LRRKKEISLSIYSSSFGFFSHIGGKEVQEECQHYLERITRLTRRMSLVEQELPTLPKHLSSPPVFSGVRVTRSLFLFLYKTNRENNGQKKKDKQRSTKHTYKTKDRVTRTTLKTGGELRCFGRVGSSCSTSSGTRRIDIVLEFC
jgi:hypothetical protein